MKTRYRRNNKLIGELLVEKGCISQEQLSEALAEQASRTPRACIGDILLENCTVHEDALLEAFLNQYLFPYIPVHSYTIDKTVLECVPAEIARRYGILPLEKNSRVLTVAMANPVHHHALQEIEKLNNCVVIPFLARPSEVRKVISHHYTHV